MTPDEAYANSAYIPDGDGYYARWDAAAAAFRAAQGLTQSSPNGEIYAPNGALRGTVVIVHGGYWMAGSPSMFSHLAAGAVAAGYVCALPSYTLAPAARIGDMTRQIAGRIDEIAQAIDGPLYLVGHSAGAHLVARMACVDMAAHWSPRVARVMAISPLTDLAPLMDTTMNDTLGIDAAEAHAESPIHHARQDMAVTAWVGSAERPAFIDQAKWLADAWHCDLTVEADRHHFDVIEGLESPVSPMMRALFR
ncbi:alpha/beta fold hydrolase [Octadecabacter sp. G9-8]|uniref:Alpha/beta fold hydrolase n=1 Tax=Octadecabacter dasysiphoniae TaxID=2909341 RepID=A0ABS9CV20_9RHOB|nr:alpha/beta fold hydrolase [Octadecabacter dasysiphoniae]MCF2871003.1 alpha/beta fold hydrolase [Octadecabacter dasysiphoniae]